MAQMSVAAPYVIFRLRPLENGDWFTVAPRTILQVLTGVASIRTSSRTESAATC